MENGEVKKLTMTGNEAAKYLGIHVNTLYRSDVPYFRIGKYKYYRKATIEQLVEDMEKTNGRINLWRKK